MIRSQSFLHTASHRTVRSVNSRSDQCPGHGPLSPQLGTRENKNNGSTTYGHGTSDSETRHRVTAVRAPAGRPGGDAMHP
eukprot:716811-Hanusia_phi.AAC.2